MPDAVGIPEEQLRKAASLSVCKINIDSDLRLAMTANIREYLAEHPADFDPRAYLKPGRQAIKDMKNDMTVIIVSQRTSSIQHADKIIVMDDGKVAGLGTHEELLAGNEIYQEIYYSQFPDKKTQNA